MLFTNVLSTLLLLPAAATAGRSWKHVNRADPVRPRTAPTAPGKRTVEPRQASNSSSFLNCRTKKYAVNGTGIPDVNFDVGLSFAGLLPITDDPKDPNQFYWWFFPSDNPAAGKEIVIWLNGGPGCSSLEGLLQENGPFIWQYGTLEPVPNPYAWNHLTNIVWVEQPIGTGFSQGNVTAANEDDVAVQFMGFWKNFINLFSMQGYKVYITGESYAGMYIPYIASHMLDAKDTTYYNVSGALFYDPSITYPVIQNQITTVPFMDYWYGLMPLNDSFSADIHSRYKSCGFEDYVNKYLVYPSAGQQPTPGDYSAECANLYNDAQNAALALNPCWDVYQVATTCPILWDVLGFPGSIPYISPGQGPLYFDRADVKKAIHAPQNVTWEECASGNVFVGAGDASLPPAVTVLGSVIDRTQNVIIGHGALDMILINNGTLLAIQNMTWGGKRGFQSKPVEPFYVPYHQDNSESNWAGAGVFGTSHTERGLTYVGVDLSGHMVPQYAPSAAWTQLEKLLGRIDSLETIRTFSTEPGYPQSSGPLGYGTAPQGYSTGGGSAKMMGRTTPGRRVGAA